MNSEIRNFSSGFERLYCDATVFASFSAFHPISFARVLPFQAQDRVVDDRHVIHAEEAHLADRNDATRQRIVDAYFDCGLLQEAEAVNLKGIIDFFAADFFELMGLVYANAGMFICALRWYREFIQHLESQVPDAGSRMDSDGIHASVGYCLYSLGLFEEAISWSKSCIGPRQASDLVCRALIGYEAQLAGGTILAVERVGPRTRYTVSALAEAAQASEATARLKTAIQASAPFEEIYMDWLSHDALPPEIQSEGYPFRVERDAGDLPRHKMNLIFATCARADALVESGYAAEAKQLLLEAAMLEPAASFVWERLKALP
jgi:tetratricopeptide (TPR) repeat protein